MVIRVCPSASDQAQARIYCHASPAARGSCRCCHSRLPFYQYSSTGAYLPSAKHPRVYIVTRARHRSRTTRVSDYLALLQHLLSLSCFCLALLISIEHRCRCRHSSVSFCCHVLSHPASITHRRVSTVMHARLFTHRRTSLPSDYLAASTDTRARHRSRASRSSIDARVDSHT